MAESKRLAITDDGLMGHRIKLLQPADGYRAGSDAVLLAASVIAKAGERVLDVGAGVGAISLCLARRCPALDIIGLEVQQTLVDLAAKNVQRNELNATVKIVAGDLTAAPAEIKNISFDHVVTNPPYYRQGRVRPPQSPSKRVAHLEDAVSLHDWLDFCLKRLKSGGCLSIIQRANRLDDIISALTARAGDIQIFPLWPGSGGEAGRIIVRARKDRRSELRLLPGLVMHGESGDYTDEVFAILRDGEALRFGD